MGGFCLVVGFQRGGSATTGATPSSLNCKIPQHSIGGLEGSCKQVVGRPLEE